MKTVFLFCFLGEKSFEHFVPSPQKTGLIKLINQIRCWVSRIACVMGWAFLLILEIFDVAADWELGCILPLWLISSHSVSLQCLWYFISTADLAEIGCLLFSPFSPDSLPQGYSPLATGRWAEQMRQHPLLASSPPSEAVYATFCSFFLHQILSVSRYLFRGVHVRSCLFLCLSFSMEMNAVIVLSVHLFSISWGYYAFDIHFLSCDISCISWAGV